MSGVERGDEDELEAISRLLADSPMRFQPDFENLPASEAVRRLLDELETAQRELFGDRKCRGKKVGGGTFAPCKQQAVWEVTRYTRPFSAAMSHAQEYGTRTCDEHLKSACEQISVAIHGDGQNAESQIRVHRLEPMPKPPDWQFGLIKIE